MPSMRLMNKFWSLGILAVLLAACGSQAASTSTTAARKTKTHVAVHRHHKSHSSAPTTTSTTTSTTSTTAAGKVPVAGGRCISSQLQLAEGHPSAAAGSVALTFSFTNTAATECYLVGYPGLQMLSSSGSSIPTHLTRGSSVSVPPEPVTKVALQPGGSAYFIVGYADATGYSGDSCPSSSSLEVTAPNDYQYLTISAALNPYGGTIQNLQCGDLTISPVLASLPAGY